MQTRMAAQQPRSHHSSHSLLKAQYTMKSLAEASSKAPRPKWPQVNGEAKGCTDATCIRARRTSTRHTAQRPQYSRPAQCEVI